MRTMTGDITGRGAREEAASGARGAGDGVRAAGEETARPGFLRRYRLPLLLGAIALCLYAGSILYILYGRGQIA